MANQIFTADEQKRLSLTDKELSKMDAADIDKAKELLVAMGLADEANKGRTGKGTRLRAGQTRGKNSKVITWESFDTDKPETLPVSAEEFMSLTKTSDEKVFVGYLIDGFNASQYAAASDMLSEYVEANWPESLARQFKLAVNNYVNAAGVSVEDAVSLMKPAIQKSFEAKLAAASQ